MAVPRPRSATESVCVTVRNPPGKVAPSPNPSAVRAAAKLQNPDANACAAEASVQKLTDAVMPTRSPMRSRMRPHTGLLNM